ncbi:MAG: F0F1 ATP synthase subunit delta, partial [Clostridia bacterium]|nr:F0F1 ATP synthase subunit delta [Clostridia bacterium]
MIPIFVPPISTLLSIVTQKDRNSAFEEIFDYFISLVKEYKNIGTAKVSSALPVTDQQKKKIEEKLLATTDYKTFEVEYVVDPS